MFVAKLWDMTNICLADAGPEIMSLIPFQLGFNPRNSIVLVSLRPQCQAGKNGLTTGLIMRIDTAEINAAVVSVLSSHLQRDGADSVLMVAYFDDAQAADRFVGSTDLALINQSLVTDFTEVISYLVMGEEFARIDSRGQVVSLFKNVSELKYTKTALKMVLAGKQVEGSRADLAPVQECSQERKEAFAAAFEESLRKVDEAKGGGTNNGNKSGLFGIVTEFHDLMQAKIGNPKVVSDVVALGRLAGGLEDAFARDTVLVSLIPGNLEKVTQALKAPNSEREFRQHPIWQSIDLITGAQGALAPDEKQMRASVALLREIEGHLQLTRGVAVFGLLAWLSWWAGQGAQADLYVNRGLEVNSEYSFLIILKKMITLGMAPGWVKNW